MAAVSHLSVQCHVLHVIYMLYAKVVLLSTSTTPKLLSKVCDGGTSSSKRLDLLESCKVVLIGLELSDSGSGVYSSEWATVVRGPQKVPCLEAQKLGAPLWDRWLHVQGIRPNTRSFFGSVML